MAVKYRIRPEVLDRARELLDCSSDEQLAVRLGIAGGTITRVRRGESPSLSTAIMLMDAADVDKIHVGAQRIVDPAPGEAS